MDDLPLTSIIIPCLNEARELPRTLLSITAEPDCPYECIVVDANSEDGTADVAASFPAVTLIKTARRGRAVQMNLGASHARGDIILFLHADCRLPAAALRKILSVCRDEGVAGGSFCLGFSRRHWVLKLCSLGSRINHPLTTYGDQGQFFRRALFQAAGGFREWPLMEDLEIQYRLRQYGRLVKIREPVISSDRRYRRSGPFLHQLFNSLLVLLYRLGVHPRTLAEWYRPDSKYGHRTQQVQK